MSEVKFRQPQDAEWRDVARLRWRWLTEEDGQAGTDRGAFEQEFARWAAAAHSHRCVVAVRERELIGMAWIAITPRVPTPLVLDRSVGDVQSVYIVPEARNSGIGSGLVDALLLLADELGLERVTVHSTTRAVAVYQRAGFTPSHRLMHFEPELPPERRPPGH
ncbi:GNAT family N-acetyltransferase [Glycomyces dulcitolivorans]|uniref:GNAT family N-acetyltransferase n=1 Tax=Glycomyces dulcitolivorans TaxID=2200759 RepID=UPI000DD4BBAC|nr:GNAT family N-acetyltransferase [Glycomyces dulcitolivorans]